MDMAHRPNTVSAWLVKNGWRGLWGRDNSQGYIHSPIGAPRVYKDFSQVQRRDPHLGTIYQNEGNEKALFIYWSNDRIKDRLAVLRDSGRWHVHPGITKDYIHQLNAESKEMKRSPVTGRVTFYWKQVRKDNHLFDCEAMQIVMALVGGVLEEEAAASVQLPLAIDSAPLTPSV
jgi:hypothetical protein